MNQQPTASGVEWQSASSGQCIIGQAENPVLHRIRQLAPDFNQQPQRRIGSDLNRRVRRVLRCAARCINCTGFCSASCRNPCVFR